MTDELGKEDIGRRDAQSDSAMALKESSDVEETDPSRNLLKEVVATLKSPDAVTVTFPLIHGMDKTFVVLKRGDTHLSLQALRFDIEGIEFHSFFVSWWNQAESGIVTFTDTIPSARGRLSGPLPEADVKIWEKRKG